MYYIVTEQSKEQEICIEDITQKSVLTTGKYSKHHCALFKHTCNLMQGGKRKRACGYCQSCKSQDCGVCLNCRDMKKFGGPGRKKKKCIMRGCEKETSGI